MQQQGHGNLKAGHLAVYHGYHDVQDDLRWPVDERCSCKLAARVKLAPVNHEDGHICKLQDTNVQRYSKLCCTDSLFHFCQTCRQEVAGLVHLVPVTQEDVHIRTLFGTALLKLELYRTVMSWQAGSSFLLMFYTRGLARFHSNPAARENITA